MIESPIDDYFRLIEEHRAPLAKVDAVAGALSDSGREGAAKGHLHTCRSDFDRALAGEVVLQRDGWRAELEGVREGGDVSLVTLDELRRQFEAAVSPDRLAPANERDLGWDWLAWNAAYVRMTPRRALGELMDPWIGADWMADTNRDLGISDGQYSPAVRERLVGGGHPEYRERLVPAFAECFPAERYGGDLLTPRIELIAGMHDWMARTVNELYCDNLLTGSGAKAAARTMVQGLDCEMRRAA